MIGKTLNHYKILDKLGEGGMGAVYLAEDTRLNRKVALKVLPGEMAQDPERLRRFEREAKVVAAINHPNIVTLYSVEEADGLKFLTMELVEGKTLGDLLPENGFTLEQFFDISIPLIEALGAAHAKGITHRDLKPANVMVTDDGRVKILDFGVAKLHAVEGAEDSGMATQTLTQQGTFLGTVAYMAPEQVKGDPPDHRSDIFALGIILYQIATGKRPFSAESPAEVISSILRDEPTPVTEIKVDLPYHLGRIIRRCLEKNPELRYQQAAELRNDLVTLKREVDAGEIEATTVIRKMPPVPGGKPAAAAADGEPAAGTKKWLPLAAGTAVVAALAVAGFLAFGRSQPEVGAPPADTPEVAGDVQEEAPAAAVPRDDVIAVFPFESRGEAPDEVFADSLADDVSSLLTALPGLNVISQSQVERDRSVEATAVASGARLGAAHILEGSIRWARPAIEGGLHRLRANLQLTRTRDGIQIWSETFDRVLDDPLDVQSDISKAVARNVGTVLLGSIPDDLLAEWAPRPAPETVASVQDVPILADPYVAESQAAGGPYSAPAAGTDGVLQPGAQPPAVRTAPPAATGATGAAQAPARRPAPQSNEPLSGLGRLLVDFASEKPSGSLTLYADDEQILQVDFEGRKGGIFGKVKRGFKGSEADGDELTREVPIPRRARELRVIVVMRDRTAPVKILPIDFRHADTWQLVVRVSEEGVVESGLRPWS